MLGLQEANICLEQSGKINVWLILLHRMPNQSAQCKVTLKHSAARMRLMHTPWSFIASQSHMRVLFVIQALLYRAAAAQPATKLAG